MSGRYAKAPLIYMTAKIRTVALPSLTSDQWATIEQDMTKLGFPNKKTGDVTKLSINVSSQDTSQPIHTVTNLKRHCFFDMENTKAVIFDQDSIEWRTTSYSRFSRTSKDIQEVIDLVCEAVEAYKVTPVQELVLSYVDCIVPKDSKDLSKYFSNGESLLPLSKFNGTDTDVRSFGSLQINRIVKEDQRVFISFEELPVINKKPSRYLPQEMLEHDASLSMPLIVNEEWDDVSSSHYALLTTQAALLITDDSNLGELDLKAAFKPIHTLTKRTFEDLINKSVCGTDWEFIED